MATKGHFGKYSQQFSPVYGKGPVFYCLNSVIDEPGKKITGDFEKEALCFWCGHQEISSIAKQFDLDLENPGDDDAMGMFVYIGGPPLLCKSCKRRIQPMKEPIDRGFYHRIVERFSKKGKR